MVKKVRLKPPLSEEVRRLEVGDMVYIDGIIYTWRDRAFERAIELVEKGEKPMPVDLRGAIHWHAGPITKKVGEKWIVASVGPTTSLRFTTIEPEAIKWGIRLIIGKGGMGKQTGDAIKKYGAAYLAAVGGAAALYAQKINDVKEVHWLELGMPEAIWVFDVRDFGPLLVAIDSHGNNLYQEVDACINRNRPRVYKSMNIDPEYLYYRMGICEE